MKLNFNLKDLFLTMKYTGKTTCDICMEPCFAGQVTHRRQALMRK